MIQSPRRRRFSSASRFNSANIAADSSLAFRERWMLSGTRNNLCRNEARSQQIKPITVRTMTNAISPRTNPKVVGFSC